MKLKSNSQVRVVYSYYVLDIVHEGHLLHMKAAKTMAGEKGISVIGILTDEAVMERKKRPILPFVERVRLAEAIRYNDCVVAQETYSPLPNLRSIKPDIIMESSSHKPKDLKKIEKFVKEIGARLVINPYFPTQSSSKIKRQIKEANNERHSS